jgi:protoporphyrinogen oxidase
MGRWLHFPLKPLDIALHAPPGFAAGVLLDAARIGRVHSSEGEESFATALERGLGPTICREFYFPYAVKIWGVDPRDLDAEQARRRVSAGTISKLAAKILGQPGKRRFFYPRGGFGAIGEAYSSVARQAGVRILTSTPVKAIDRESSPMVVHAEADGKGISIPASLVLSTIPMPAAVALMRPAAPADVLALARSLRYRAMTLVYLVLPVKRFGEFDAHYFPSPEIAITRLSETKNYGLSGPASSTVLCAEIPCDVGDAVWSLEERGLRDLVLESLSRAGMPWHGKVSRTVVRRLRQAYPIYDRGYGTAMRAAGGWLDSLVRFVTLGRQGLFVHDNTHHTLAMAYAAAACVLRGGDFDHAAWSLRRREFEAFTVED